MTNSYDDIHGWFGLTYASFLTLPRVLMESMPPDWQRRMVGLLNEYDEAFPNRPDLGTRVQITHKRKLIKTPPWILQYRHPNHKVIDEMRGKVNEPQE